MNLDDLIHEAAKKGLTHLSLVPTPSADGKKIYWAATATPSTMHKYINCADEDPVAAMKEVLKALPKAPMRQKRGIERPQKGLDVTATVNPDEPPEETELNKWLPKTKK